MSNPMDNRSFDDRNSLTGNSGLLGLSSLKPKLQPINIKAFLDMYGSDEEDSEDKGRDSNSDSESDDIQPLPEDPDEGLVPVSEEDCPVSPISPCRERENIPLPSQRVPRRGSIVEQGETSECPISKHFTDNFTTGEHQKRRSGQETGGLRSESRSTNPHDRATNPSLSTNRRSNVKFEIPEASKETPFTPLEKDSAVYTSSGHKNHCVESIFESVESTYYSKERNIRGTEAEPVSSSAATLEPPYAAVSRTIPEKALSTETPLSKQPIRPNCRANGKLGILDGSSETPAICGRIEAPSEVSTASDRKFDTEESRYYAKEKHVPSGSASQPELVPSSSCALQPPVTPRSHLATDTPMKTIQPHGSSRPTPSTSHRNIFQTPRGSSLHQDSSKNHVQTPATIFGNWSKNHMSQTPLQNRLPSCDTVARTQAPPIVSQQLSSHNIPLYRGNDEKRVRRPLAESIQSIQANQHIQNDKLSPKYNVEGSSSSKTYDDSNCGLSEHAVEKSLSEPAVQSESKENRRPRTTEKSSINEEALRGRVSESLKDSVGIISTERANENSVKPKDDRVKAYEQHPASFRAGNSMLPGSAVQKKNLPERQNNVQVSIPSRIRPSNQIGQTITVKGTEYLILGTLGEGMSGQVLRVQDIENAHLRAIKIVDLSRLDKDCAQGCLQEISMLHKLQAPCIVTMFDYEIKYPMVRVVLEMGDTDFKSLLNSMSEKSRLPLTMILYYWTEMLTAVKHIHDNGVIHSDLKPANFLLVRGRLKLIDFGIASSMNGDMTSVVKNNPIGTLNYISPEALMDISGSGDSPNRNVKYKISFKSDVWSLGCILYSLVYGYTPFHNIRTQWAKVSAITNPHPKISFALPSGNDSEPTPPILIDVMRKCLQHDPKARPTVAQLLQIPYIPIKQISPSPVPDIPSNILMKIKYSLTDSEWRKFTEIMEAKRSQ